MGVEVRYLEKKDGKPHEREKHEKHGDRGHEEEQDREEQRAKQELHTPGREGR